MSNVESMLSDETARAERVEILLVETGAEQNLQEYRQSLIDGMISTKAGDDDGRRRIWQAIAVTDIIIGQFREILNTGKIADAQMREIEGKQTMLDRVRR